MKAKYKVADIMVVNTEKVFPEYYAKLKEMNLIEEEVVEKDPNARPERMTKDMEEKKQIKETKITGNTLSRYCAGRENFRTGIRTTCLIYHKSSIPDIKNL